MNSATEWKILGAQRAALRCGPLTGFVRLDRGWIRFSPAEWKSRRIDSMGVLDSGGPDERNSPLQLSELYVRGADLVADFAIASPHRIAPQVYWHAALDPHFDAVRIELVLSVRTELLDSAPAWTVFSGVKSSSWLHAERLDDSAFEDLSDKSRSFQRGDSTVHLFLFRNREAGCSYAEMVHPSDFMSAKIAAGPKGSPVVRSTVFPDRLEKGVIRRARICGWFLPMENDLAVAVELAKKFVTEPLPLTA